MAKEKKVEEAVKPESVVEDVKPESPERVAFKALIERYKKQSPERYERIKAELDAQLNRIQ